MLSIHEIEYLVHAYLAHMQPIYAILDPSSLKDGISSRWQNPTVVDDYDSILCVVGALGSLFSGDEPHPRESDLVKCARVLLENSSIMSKPTLHHAVAWVLWKLYLRSTNNPYACWMASCTTIHVIEATGSHRQANLDTTNYYGKALT